MSPTPDRSAADNSLGSETDGRNRPKADHAAVLREIHMSLIRAEENLFTLLEASHDGSLVSRDSHDTTMSPR